MPEVASAAHLLTRHSHRRRGRGAVTLMGEVEFERARVHEICGRARRRLAVMVAGAMQGPVFWIQPAWIPVRLNPEGMLSIADPSRFIFLTPKRPEDLLWTMEEALRAGIVPLVVADLPHVPGLTAVRRLHLAAETGAEEGKVAPLGLLLGPGDGGAPGVETRWSIEPAHGDNGHEAWHLGRLRARMQPEKRWTMEGGKGGPRLAPATPQP